MQKLLLLSLLLPAAVSAQEGPFTVKGKIGKLGAPATIFLSYRAGDNMVTDSAVLDNGKFQFTGKVSGALRASLTLRHQPVPPGPRMMNAPSDRLSFYLDKGTLSLNSADSISKASITGSVVNKEYAKLQELLKPLNAKRAELNKYYSSATPENRKDAAWLEGYRAKSTAISNEEKDINAAFIKQYPASMVSLDALQAVGGSIPDVTKIEPLFTSLSGNVKSSTRGVEYGAMIDKLKNTAVGAIAPLFTQNDPDGKPVKLDELRGKYVLIDFWASWCGPCRAENPNVVKSYQTYKDKNFTILGVSLDNEKGKEAWLNAIKDDGLPWLQVSDLKYWNNEVAKLYAVRAIPQNFLVDPSGRIVAKDLRGAKLEEKLAELMP